MRTAMCLIALFTSLPAFSQKQGIQGQVFWVSGDQMPAPDQRPTNPRQGILREIHIYPAIYHNSTQNQGEFYHSIDATPVAKVFTDQEGNFKVKLPAGKYSVFTKEQKGLFANLMDVKGCINCIEVKPKKYTWITITVDYEAAY
jgi:hypothetical protein